MNLDILKKEVSLGSSRIRRSSHKASIRGDFNYHEEKGNIEIFKKRGGKIQIKWSGNVGVKSTREVKCDMGHFHQVEETEHWVWNYCDLNKTDIEKLIEFLQESL